MKKKSRNIPIIVTAVISAAVVIASVVVSATVFKPDKGAEKTPAGGKVTEGKMPGASDESKEPTPDEYRAMAASVTDEATLRALLAAKCDLEINVTAEIPVTSTMDVWEDKTVKGAGKITADAGMQYGSPVMWVNGGASLYVSGFTLDGGNIASGINVAKRGSLTYDAGVIENVSMYGVRADGEAQLKSVAVTNVNSSAVSVDTFGKVSIDGGDYQGSADNLFFVSPGGEIKIGGDIRAHDAPYILYNRGEAEVTDGKYYDCTLWAFSNYGIMDVVYRGGARGGYIEFYDCNSAIRTTAGNSHLMEIKRVHAHDLYNNAVDISSGVARAVIENCIFENIVGGRGIYAAGKSLDVRNVVFRDIDSTNTAGLVKQGGAIDVNCPNGQGESVGLFTAEDCVFENCATGISGAAIVFKPNATGTIKDCAFRNGRAYGSTGAIKIETDAAVTVADSDFIGNYGKGLGGAINCDQGILTLRRCLFEKNTTDGPAAAIYFAPNVKNPASKLTCIDCDFKENTAKTSTGVMMLAANTKATFTDCLFEKNEDLTGSGAVSNCDKGSVLTFTDCDFRYNKAKTYAGALNCNSGIIRINDCDFTGNEANIGGAFFVHGSAEGHVYCEGSGVFRANKAAAYGGAVAVQDGASFSSDGYDFTENEGRVTDDTTGGCGALYVIGNKSYAECENADFTGNRGGRSGGAILFAKGTSGKFVNCNFKKNESTKASGGVLKAEAATVDFSDCEFRENLALTWAGVANISQSEATFTDCDFLNNTASKNGGGVFNVCGANPTSKVTVSGRGRISGNSSGTAGGAFSILDGSALTVTGYEIEENTVGKGGGGAAWISTGSLTLDDCEVKNHSVTGDGGAVLIESGGTLKADSSAFKGHEATGNGGSIAVKNNNSKAVLTDCRFTEGNEAAGNGGAIAVTDGGAAEVGGASTFDGCSAAGKGGAIWCDVERVDQPMKITGGCTFTGNHADGDGGAVFCDRLSIDGAVFTENSSGARGGAVYNHNNGNGKLDMTNARFTENKAKSDAGAAYILSNATVTGCEFTENKCAVDATSTANGGAIAMTKNTTLPTVNISDSKFTGNQTLNNCGGAMSNSSATLTVTGCLFENNTSQAQGGAFYQNNPNANTTFAECIFKTNTGSVAGGSGGGAVMANNGSLTVKDTAFNGNINENGSAEGIGGGAVALLGVTATVTRTEGKEDVTACGQKEPISFKDNQTKKNGGGAISLIKGASVTVTGYKFEENSSAAGGGAIAARDNSQATATGCEFGKNTCQGGGGAAWISTGSLTLDNCEVKNHSVTGDGGAVFVEAGGTLKANKSTFTGHEATGSGGAIALTGGSQATATDCDFKQNTSAGSGTYDGGGSIAVKNNNSKAVLTDCRFTEGNEAAGNGGAIAVTDGGAAEVGGASTFDGCSAAGKGGAIWCDVERVDQPMKITGGCTFTGNHADGDGGAVFCDRLSIDGAVFTENSSGARGGAVYNHNNGNGKLDMTNARFTENKAKSDAGAAYILSNATVTGCEFTENKCAVEANDVRANGGAIAMTKAANPPAPPVINISNSKFTGNNTANNCGGAMSNSSAALTVTGCLFENNTSSAQGGAFYQNNQNANTAFAECVFKNNTASQGGGYGGGAMMANKGSLTVTDTAFDGNINEKGDLEGIGGGAVALLGVTVTVTRTEGKEVVTACGQKEPISFKDNQTKKNGGGAISLINGASVTVTGYTFEGNSAAVGGGAIAERDKSQVTATGCEFSKNKSLGSATADNIDGGGAIAVTGGSQTTATDCDFKGNTSETIGGAIAVRNDKEQTSKATLTDCRFTDKNEAKANGGAIAANDGGVTEAKGCTFDGCVATGNGGAVWSDVQRKGAQAVRLAACVFTNNKATGNGGAIFSHYLVLLTGDNGEKGSFKGNTAAGGNAIALNTTDANYNRSWFTGEENYELDQNEPKQDIAYLKPLPSASARMKSAKAK